MLQCSCLKVEQGNLFSSALSSVLQAFYALRYKQHEKYDSHMDVFDPAEYGPQKSLRLATMIVYLSDVEAGGETIFKREGKDGERAGAGGLVTGAEGPGLHNWVVASTFKCVWVGGDGHLSLLEGSC